MSEAGWVLVERGQGGPSRWLLVVFEKAAKLARLAPRMEPPRVGAILIAPTHRRLPWLAAKAAFLRLLRVRVVVMLLSPPSQA